jgi:hypothetical protein
VDLRLFSAVLWHFKFVVAIGLMAAMALSFFSFAKLDLSAGSPKIKQRGTEQWASYSTIFVTQKGFPWGRVNGDPNAVLPSQAQGGFANPSRYIGLAAIFANLADSDQVRQVLRRSGPLYGKIEATPLTALNDPTDVLPLISIVGLADTARRAEALVGREARALTQYVAEQQDRNKIRDQNRIELQIVKEPTKAKLIAGPSKTLPILVFLVVIAATCAVAFILENLNPRLKIAERSPSELPAAEFDAA